MLWSISTSPIGFFDPCTVSHSRSASASSRSGSGPSFAIFSLHPAHPHACALRATRPSRRALRKMKSHSTAGR